MSEGEERARNQQASNERDDWRAALFVVVFLLFFCIFMTMFFCAHGKKRDWRAQIEYFVFMII